MTAASGIAVAGWAWRAADVAGTIVAAVITAALCAVLVWHVLLAAWASPRDETQAEGGPEAPAPSPAKDSPLRRRLVRASVHLGGWFAIVVFARFAIILIERPGP